MSIRSSAPIIAPGVVTQAHSHQPTHSLSIFIGIGSMVVVGLIFAGLSLLVVIRNLTPSSTPKQVSVPTGVVLPPTAMSPTLAPTQPLVLVQPTALPVVNTPLPVINTRTPVPSPTRSQTDVQRAALACVLIVIFEQGQSGDYYSGSGTIIDERGLILTNFHVVRNSQTGNPFNRTDLIFVLVNSSADRSPDRTFRAQVIAQDRALDLAVLKLIATEDGKPLPANLGLTTLPVGNSDNVQIGERIRVLGFPGLGGVSVTLTEGVVAGFVSNRAWIKTDTEISHGNSGGTAINQNGELIGLPTRVVSDPDTSGKIGLIRPINSAKPLIAQATK